MNKLIFTIILTSTFVLLGFYRRPADQLPSNEIKAEFLHDYNLLQQQAQKLREVVEGSDNRLDWKEELLRTRETYKRCEYLLVRLDPMFVSDFFNGAPLPVVERGATRLAIMEPEGLQVMDEMLFLEHPAREELLAYVQSFQHNLESLKPILTAYPLLDREIFEAMRQEVITIFSLSLTGYDTPGSANALPESAAAWQRLTETYAHYSALVREINPDLDAKVVEALENGKQLLRSGDFETFDRFAFLRRAADPLYAGLYDVHRALNIETIELTTDIPQHWNYHERQLFGRNLLNAATYAGIPEDQFRPEVIALGEKLFYETKLSGAGDLSCGSCHNPELGFSDGQPKSTATGGNGTVGRNSPGLVHAVFAAEYFYDLRADQLMNQAEHVIVAENEFNTTYAEIFEKLQSDSVYYSAFQKAFPSFKEPVIQYTFSVAIASYVATLQAGRSAFDQWARGESEPTDAAAIRGFNLFMGKAACGTCHFAPTFAGLVPPYFEDSETEVLGVPEDPNAAVWTLDSDVGRYNSGKAKDQAPFYEFSFKTTTVRNVERTAPYMHNGSFETLEQVLEFYNNGGGLGHGLELEYQTLSGDSLGLTEQELADLEAFMLSLTEPLLVNGEQ